MNIRWGCVKVDKKVYKDAIVTYLPEKKQINSVEWDWSLTNFHHKPGYSNKAKNKLLSLIGEDIVNSHIIFSLGINEAIQFNKKSTNPLIEYLQSESAVKRFNELMKKEAKVVAFIHSTC